MYLDFHTHGKLAKKLPFSTAYTDWLFGEAKGAGLDALCLTEHFNTLQFDELYGYLMKTCDRKEIHWSQRMDFGSLPGWRQISERAAISSAWEHRRKSWN